MSEVIKHHSLDLKFEKEYLPDFKCDGLLLHDYKPRDNEDRCNEEHEMLIGLRINGDKIECVYPECNHDWRCIINALHERELIQDSFKNDGVH